MLERTLKLKFKTTGSSSPSVLTINFFGPAIGGAWAPLVYASDYVSKKVRDKIGFGEACNSGTIYKQSLIDINLWK